MTYEEFMKIIPNETKDFINELIPHLNYYDKKEIKIDELTIPVEATDFLLTINVLLKDPYYKNILINCGIKNSKEIKNLVLEKKSNEKNEEYFNDNYYNFLICNEEKDYSSLTPLDLLIDLTKKLIQKIELHTTPVFSNKIYNIENKFFNKNLEDFLNNLIRVNNNIKNEQIKKEIFSNTNIDVINFLDNASKIKTIINSYLIKKDKILEDQDLTALSILIAIFYTNSKECKQIKTVLNDTGVTIEKIFNKLGINGISQSDIEDIIPNYLNLNNEYKNYFDNNNNETILNIFKKIFNRKITNSFAIEDLFNKMNINFDQFKDFDNLITASINRDLLFDLPKKTQEYIIFSAKAYTYLKEKLKDKDVKLVSAPNDFTLLSFYLASVKYNTAISQFFNINGATLDKVTKFLGIEVDLEEIESTEIDYFNLPYYFKKYTHENNCTKDNLSDILIQFIESNLTNTSITQNKLLHIIFENITGVKLQNDFSYQMNDNIIKYDEKRKQQLKEEYFKNLPIETIYFLENIMNIDSQITFKEEMSNEDRQILVLILALFDLENNQAKDFISFLGTDFDKNEVNRFINAYYNNCNYKNIKDLINNYDKYIFEGNNKGKEKPDITVYSIARNIFNKDFNNSVFINKFFDHFKIDPKAYEKYDQLYQEFLKEIKRKEKESAYEQKCDTLYSYSQNSQNIYLNILLKIHYKLLDKKIPNIKNIAMLLAILKFPCLSATFLNKNGLTTEKVLTYLNLPNDFLDNIDDIELEENHYDIFINNYSNFKPFDYINIFNSPEIIKMINDLGIDYKILKYEVDNERDYELSLSVDERIKILNNKPIDNLDVDDIESIIKFGNSLNYHSQYIHDEFPKMMINDSTNESVKSINDTLNEVYTLKKEEKPKSIWEKLFAIETTDEPKYVLNTYALYELKDKIDKNIQKLSSELLQYNNLRKYIEAYRKKNEIYLNKINETLNILLDEQNNQSEQDDYSDILLTSTNLQIIKSKLERFKTSKILLQQELIKINQAIVNHFTTINALEMAKNDLLPLITTEVALNNGINSEYQSIEMAQNIFNLFKSLLDKNQEDTNQNIELLKQSSLSSDMLSKINADVELYLHQLSGFDTPLLDENPKTLKKEAD